MVSISETFFTTVGCMDGRCVEPVISYGREKFGALYPDTITRAGLDGLLPKQSEDLALLDSIKNKLTISIEKHHSKGVVVHGHQECAGNPVDDETHKEHIIKTVEIIKKLTNNVVPVIGVFIKRSNDAWEVEEVTE